MKILEYADPYQLAVVTADTSIESVPYSSLRDIELAEHPESVTMGPLPESS